MGKENLLLPRIPIATYRLQFNRYFKFSHARTLVSYLYDLGITDIYASPYFKAKEGSLHGYDIVDHNTLDPEIGTEEEYNELVNKLWEYGMGQILDIVPNHMCITSKENVLWMDVLENGPSSIYEKYFDIDWEPIKKELKDKVLLPILGDQYGNVLDRQELKLNFEEGAFIIQYYEHNFPVRPKTYIDILKHEINELEKSLSPENPHYIELLSIITAINYLPSYTEKDKDKIVERDREKEIIKKRLWNLYSESAEIKNFIDENMRIFNGEKGEPRSLDLLDFLISQQVYRLSNWRVATEEINYRRFFDINDLAAIRMEDPIVFRDTHRLVCKLIKAKKITGLRIDHPDGLYNPSEYFKKLQQNCFSQMRLNFIEKERKEIPVTSEQPDVETEMVRQYEELLSSDPDYKPCYIVGEKILTKGERMPEEWPIYSTTGYVFLNSVNGIFIETKNTKAFDDIYSRFIKTKINFQDIVYEKKKLVMQVAMSSEINTLGLYLNRISEKNRHTRDFTLNSLTSAIVETIAFFPVYRTYINRADIKDRDRQYIEAALSKAKRKNPAISESIFNFLRDVLLLRFPEDLEDEDKNEWLDFAMRFQQITGPVMAKGLEDTAFYVFNRFISLNEVGGSPDRFGTPLETFHGQNIERIKFWPHALIATSTHDTKRSEDVRARLNVLSELPGEWRECLRRWSKMNKKKKVIVDGWIVPDKNEEYLLYQTLIGVWPVGQMDESAYEIFKKRIKDYMLKALREAKDNTSWISPDILYEDAVMTFIEAILKDVPDNQYLKDFIPFCKKILQYGMYNSLSMILLKITCPGVPDFYQGTEIWNFSLVDPDNRIPVDYKVRIEMLEELKRQEAKSGALKLAREITLNKENGMIKLYMIYKALNFRRERRELFEKGEYIPIESLGDKVNSVCSYVRRLGNSIVLVVVPRFLTGLMEKAEALPFGEEVWKDTHVVIPFEETEGKYRNIFTGEVVTVSSHGEAIVLFLSEVFANFPVALMEKVV